jgi:2,5-diketo-D-gluconate reductase A
MDITSTFPLHTGRSMPSIGLGTWELTDKTPGTVAKALGMGYRMIDTSGDYGTQRGIGEGLRRSNVARTNVFLVTKVEEDEDAYDATVADLRELGEEFADLMLIHRPPDSGVGTDLWRGLIRARDDGLTREIGVSNYSIRQIEELVDATGEVPVVNQIEWTPFGWSEDMFDYCRSHGIVIQAYSPLTRGERLDDKRLNDIADEIARTPAQVVLRWNLQMKVAPLPKANRPGHLEENLAAFDFELSDAHMHELNELNEGWSSLGGSLPYV